MYIYFIYLLELFQINREVYNRARTWFERLDPRKQTLIIQRLEGYPPCDDLILGSSNHLYLFLKFYGKNIFIIESF